MKGRKDIQIHVETVQRAFPDINMTTMSVIEEGNTVLGVWTWRAVAGHAHGADWFTRR